jgi:hypothetical protein
MADRSLRLLSKNRLDDWSIVGCIRLSCLNFWTKVYLPEFFEITSRQQAKVPRGLEPVNRFGFFGPLPSGGQWLHEIKHDGFRIIARKTGRQTVRRPFGDENAFSIISMKAELI